MLAVFVPAHTVGGEQIEIAVFGHGHGQRDRIVTEENSPDREGVFVVLADETFVADCLDFEFHFAALFGGCRYSSVKSRVAMRRMSPRLSVCFWTRTPLTKVPFVEPQSSTCQPAEVLLILP